MTPLTSLRAFSPFGGIVANKALCNIQLNILKNFCYFVERIAENNLLPEKIAKIQLPFSSDFPNCNYTGDIPWAG